LPGRAFTGADIRWAKSVRKPSLEEFVLGLRGSRIQAVQRRAKYILLPLDTGSTLVLHLGMTGGLILQHQDQPSHPMVRHCFFLDDGRGLCFLDPRKFAKLWLAADASEMFRLLGPEPLEAGFTAEVLARALAGHHIPIKALLLEQSVVAGLGNLYADESLYLAGIHPLRRAAELSGEETTRLRNAIVAALSGAVAQYDLGRADPSLEPPIKLIAWTIPRKLGAPCPRCGGPIAGIRVRGRSTYLCPRCQI